ncbi:MAG: hypothetical protein ACRD11_15285 [Terriglobia bacterium]
MGLLNHLRKINREHWFICYTCMGDSGHEETKSIFHSLAPKVLVVGRPWQQCPRCGGTNTKSFTDLKNEGMDSALWGLERIVKKNPRSVFEVTRL